MRLIDADATIELLRSLGSRDYRREKGTIADAMKMLSHSAYTPTIEAEPVRHGRWVDRYGNKYANQLYECSECKEKALYRFEVDGWGRETEVQDLSDFCPHCGARMDGDTNDSP